MILKNIRTFLKHLVQNKLYTMITITGFSVSLMFVILLSVYIQKEYSSDRFHVNKDRIYRLVHDTYSGFACPTGPLLKDKYPEVENYTRIYKQEGYATVNTEEKLPIKFLMADSAFFKMFSFKLIEGMQESVLRTKNSIVLSESYARRLFREKPIIGSVVKVDDVIEYKVTGIMEDMPVNTHFDKVDAIVDFPSLAVKWNHPQLLTTYSNNSFGLYVMAKKNTFLPAKASEILELFKEVNWMYKREYAKEVVFEPLTDIYFGTSYSPGIKQGSKTLLKVLSAIVIMILFLSILNYINLTIAQSGTRSKEIAIKKLMGSKKTGILIQYTYESVLISLFACAIALVLSFLVEPVFNYLLNTNLQLKELFGGQFLGLSFLAATVIGIVSGIIPAITISKFDPIDVVKGVFRMKSKASYSKVLISFQYLIIITLITSAIFINKQTQYLRNFDLGYQKDQVLCITNNIDPKQQQSFKSILEEMPGVEHVCLVSGNPVDGGNNNSFEYKGKSLSFQTFVVDTSFFTMMGMDVKPTGAALADNAVWLNETAVKEMELEEGFTSVKIYDNEVPVYGVVKDFHFRNLKEVIGPAYFKLLKPGNYAWSTLVKVSDKNVLATVDKIKIAFDQYTHGLPLTMSFMDETINKWYEREERIGKMVKYFTILTIIISVMGLFAMSLYYVQQKTKEIGVRKVNGAKVSEVLAMLNKDFLKWVIIAFVLACPLSYYALNKWLEGFAYKSNLDWWIFALAGAIALGIALLTVSWQSWRAANRNPVEALRYE